MGLHIGLITLPLSLSIVHTCKKTLVKQIKQGNKGMRLFPRTQRKGLRLGRGGHPLET
jgi:hypothetical protein